MILGGLTKADLKTRLITNAEWLATYRSLDWHLPSHHMHCAYQALLAEEAARVRDGGGRA